MDQENDKAQALQDFWSSFGIEAIDEQSAYDSTLDIPDEYITYEVQTGNFGDSVPLTASLWYRTTSWSKITKKAEEIANNIGYGGKVLKTDSGYIWIKLRNPFAQRMAVDQDDSFRRIILNISVDFLSAT